MWTSLTLSSALGIVLGMVLLFRAVRNDDSRLRLVGAALIGVGLGYFTLWGMGVIPALLG